MRGIWQLYFCNFSLNPKLLHNKIYYTRTQTHTLTEFCSLCFITWPWPFYEQDFNFFDKYLRSTYYVPDMVIDTLKI